jgi:hypothetical protein
MPQRVVGFVVGSCDDQRLVGLAQDRRAENLVPGFHTTFGQRQDIEIDDVEQPGSDRRGYHRPTLTLPQPRQRPPCGKY